MSTWWERVTEWPHWWNAANTLIASGALFISWRYHRRLANADKRVEWTLEQEPGQSVFLRNLGPADAFDVQVSFGTEPGVAGPQSHRELEHSVIQKGSRVWVASFFPQSLYTPRDRVHVTWRGGPEGGWSDVVQ